MSTIHLRMFTLAMQEQDGRPLSPAQKEALRAHLAACPACRADLRLSQELRSQAVKRWPMVPSPVGLAQIMPTVDRQRRWQRVLQPLQVVLVVGLVALLFFLAQYFSGYVQPVPADQPPGPVQPTPTDMPLTYTTPESEITAFTTLREEIEYGHLGGALDLQGEVVVAGAPHWQRPPGYGAGAAYVYRRDLSGAWRTEAELTGDLQPEDEMAGPDFEQHFGEGVSIWGEQIAVGAPGYDDPSGVENSGAVYIFDDDGSGWVRTALLLPSQPVPEGKLGSSVVLWGDYLAVSGYPAAGEVLVFKQEAGAWRETARLPVPAFEDGTRPYVLIDLYGETLAVSAFKRTVPDEDAEESAYFDSLYGAGAVTLYQRSGEEWLPVYHSPPQEAAPFYIYEGPFGFPVALGGEDGLAAWLAVGRPGFPGSGIETGSVTIFERQAQGWAPTAELHLEQGIPVNGALPSYFFNQQETSPSDLGPVFFGASVVIQGDRLAVISTFANTAYLFERQGSVWTYLYRIVPLAGPEGLVGDDFQRRRVAFEGDTFLLSNPGELGGGFICVFDLSP